MWANMEFEKELHDQESNKTKGLKDTLSCHPTDWALCLDSDIKLGDIVYVEYSPDSQKYLYTHCPEYGTVHKIQIYKQISPFDNKIIEVVSIDILNHNGEIVNLNKEPLSIYSRGYCMYIEKYK